MMKLCKGVCGFNGGRVAFDEREFKRGWRKLCAEKGVDPEWGSPVGNIYMLVNLRAERRKKQSAARLFDSRCLTPDDGLFHFEDAKLRPMEVKPEIEIWDIIGMEMARELWHEAKQEATLARLHRCQIVREAERLEA